jgi:ribulose 1,5-bisphosphate synthetase/thiazole synthase
MNYCKLVFAVVSVICGSYATAQTNNELYEADVVVYGDASGGVTAAIQAARLGKEVILVSQYGHLGGMTSSGLG